MSDQEKAELAEQNMPLVWYVVNRYAGATMGRDELYSAALLGMARALSAYDHTKEVKFSTFAVICMNREILKLLRSAKKRGPDISYESQICSPNDGDEIRYGSFVCVTTIRCATPDDIATKIVVRDFIERLPERSKEILQLRMGGMRQKEIAERIGLSQPQIGRLLADMRDRLWKELYLR